MGLRISIKGRVCPSVRSLVGLSNHWSHGSALFLNEEYDTLQESMEFAIHQF